MVTRIWVRAILTLLILPAIPAMGADLPPEIAANGEAVVLEVHAAGAQIYECKPDKDGRLIWQFREPIASLFRDGKTVGRHYAGPKWEIEGSIIVGKVTGRAPGATANDIPWLKLSVSDSLGDPDGPLEEVTAIQRIDTQGGNREGPCEKAGDLVAEPYAADYIFLRKTP
jgi:hypothetical protein